MTIHLFLSFLLYAIITAITPGPNNILVLNAVMNYGYTQSRRVIFGVYTGFCSIMVLCGLFSNALVMALPDIISYLKVFGVLYIFYLSYKIVLSKPDFDNKGTDDSRLGFFNGFVLQFINVKIILYGVTIFTSFVLPFYTQWYMTFAFIVLACVIGMCGTGLWIVVGRVFETFLRKRYKAANIIMAAILAISGIQILFAKH